MNEAEKGLMYRDIRYTKVPCWYELTAHEDYPDGMVLRIHRDFIEGSKFSLQESRLIPVYQKMFDCREINFDLRNGAGKIGFNQCLEVIETTGPFLRYLIPFPKNRFLKGACEDCRKSGKDDDYPNRRCLRCEGTGKVHVIDYKREAYATATTLNIVLSYLSFPEVMLESERNQLITVTTGFNPGMHGAPVHGSFSRGLVGYLDQFRGKSFLEIRQFMIHAHEIMDAQPLPDYYSDGYSFRAYVQDHPQGRFVADCPGDACGIFPDFNSADEGRGYEFGCHNMDQLYQQFTSLAALAKLHQLAREAGV